LKAGLSQATPAPGAEAVPVAVLAERIKALKAGHSVEAAPERTKPRRIAAEVPVTARIRRRSEPTPVIEPPAEPEVAPLATPIAATAPEAQESVPLATEEPPAAPPAEPSRPRPDYRQQYGRRQEARQLSLF
jgi:hypothetical protein